MATFSFNNVRSRIHVPRYPQLRCSVAEGVFEGELSFRKSTETPMHFEEYGTTELVYKFNCESSRSWKYTAILLPQFFYPQENTISTEQPLFDDPDYAFGWLFDDRRYLTVCLDSGRTETTRIKSSKIDFEMKINPDNIAIGCNLPIVNVALKIDLFYLKFFYLRDIRDAFFPDREISYVFDPRIELLPYQLDLPKCPIRVGKI